MLLELILPVIILKAWNFKKMNFFKNKTNESGNVLFLILIAVALFAALSYVVSSSSRSGSGSIDKERAQLIAAQILSYSASISTAITRLSISNSCADTDISFETPETANNYIHSPPVQDKCKVFNITEGGAVPYQLLPEWVTKEHANASDLSYAFWVAGDTAVQNAKSAAPDLILTMPWMPDSICNAINLKSIGSGYTGVPPTPNAGTFDTTFTGTYGADANYAFPANSPLAGKTFGCGFDAVNGYNGFYYVVLER